MKPTLLHSTAFFAATAAMVAYSGLSTLRAADIGADTSTPSTQAPTADKQSTSASSGTAAVQDQVPAATKQQENLLVRGTSLVGANVSDQKGQNIGNIEDLIADEATGRITHAIVSAGAFLGMNDRLTPVPIQLIQYQEPSDVTSGTSTAQQGSTGQSSSTAQQDTRNVAERGDVAKAATGERREAMRSKVGSFVLNVDENILKGAPHFESNSWPSFDKDWNARLLAHFKIQPASSSETQQQKQESAAATQGQGAMMKLVRVAKLHDADLLDPQGKEMGEFQDTLIQLKANRIAYAIVEVDRPGVSGDKLTAIPFKLIRQAQQGEGFVFNGDRTKLNSAPFFGSGSYPNINDRTWNEEMSRHYSVEPYWSPMASR